MSVGCTTGPHAGSQSVLHCDDGALVLLFLGTFPRANLGATAVQYSAVVDSENVSVELFELGMNTTVQKPRKSWGVFTLRPKFTGNCRRSLLQVLYKYDIAQRIAAKQRVGYMYDCGLRGNPVSEWPVAGRPKYNTTFHTSMALPVRCRQARSMNCPSPS
jgi:hypothetical protein